MKKVSRRDFLKVAVATGATITLEQFLKGPYVGAAGLPDYQHLSTINGL